MWITRLFGSLLKSKTPTPLTKELLAKTGWSHVNGDIFTKKNVYVSKTGVSGTWIAHVEVRTIEDLDKF